MTRASDLDDAVSAGIITGDQAERLKAFLTERAASPAGETAAEAASWEPGFADEENVRFIRGFQDVFVTIGIALLLAGVAIAGPMIMGPTAGTYAGALVAFLLARGFAKRRKLVLPSIALAIGFTLFAGVGTAIVLGGNGWDMLVGGWQSNDPGRIPLIGGMAALAASGLFFAVFRLPFALALVALSATLTVLGGVALVLGVDVGAVRLPVFLVAGLITFAAAMIFDLGDPARKTIRADNAFWLHLVAAPLIVHAVVGLLVAYDAPFTAVDAIVVVATVLALGLVAITIDRRALLVAGLGYLGYALAVLMNEASMTTSAILAATLVLVGAFVAALGTGWRPIRHALVGRLAPRALLPHLPPA